MLIQQPDQGTPRKIFIVQDRNYWTACEPACSVTDDVVFAIDFGLYHQLKKQGFKVAFFDRYLSPAFLQDLNEEMHAFLNGWFNANGNDQLVYKQYSLGDAFLLSILSDITYFCHFFINFQGLSDLKSQEIVVATEPELVSIFEKTGIRFTSKAPEKNGNNVSYLFPIKKWMSEKINPTSLSMKFKNFVAKCFDYLFYYIDAVIPPKPRIFIQEYFCTFPIISQLRTERKFQVVTSNYSGIKNIFRERRILYRDFKEAQKSSRLLLDKIKSGKGRSWMINGTDIAPFLYEIIFGILESELSIACSSIESIERYFRKGKPVLMVPISDLWMRNRLVITFCKKNGIPVFCIVNGLLSLSFWQEAKDADWINSYGEAAKKDFFRNDPRVVPLGDPRMDVYFNTTRKKINHDTPTILIGTSAFNLIDLNSFVAVEFDFMYGVLSALQKIRASGRDFEVRIKIRSNGYRHLYESFAAEYFPGFGISFYQDENFGQVLKNADLYISFYSQTLLEAAAMGIPSIYYKNDGQIMLPPFDNKSEVVTVTSEDELTDKIAAFFVGSDIFDEFRKRTVIEKYMGALDGKSVNRNVDFIKQLAQIKADQA